MRRIFLRAVFLAALLSWSSLAAAAEFKVFHAETISARASDLSPDADGSSSKLSFQAYGQQFDLALTSNARLLSRLTAAQKTAWSRFALYRGTIVGRPGSWVRLTRVGDELHGAFWDGRELYTIAPARAVAPFALQSLNATDSDPVIYRLADTESVLNTAFCGVGPEHGLASAAIAETLFAELRQDVAAAALATEQIEIAFIADFELSSRFGANTQGEMLARVNVVDGIYDGQLGIAIVPTFQIFTDTNDRFSSTTAASDLLSEVGTFRQSTPAIRARGLAHLMTGRDLDGNTAGVAFLDSLCQAFAGVGLSEATASVTIAGLVMAHEIGHNFGAPHDAEPGSVCESTPATFLMAPRITGSSTFSQCSLDQIRPNAAAASCITPLATTDAALSVPGGTVSAVTGTAFNVNVDVNSIGTATINNVVVTATPGANLTVDSATVPSGSCTTGANGVVTCTLGSLAASTTRRITLQMQASAAGATQVAFGLTATSDGSAQNNSATAAIAVGAPSTPPPPPSNGGGGGGVLEWFGLALLLGACAARTRIS